MILEDERTKLVIKGTVTATKAFLYENPVEQWTAGQKPQWEAFTRVTLEVAAVLKGSIPERTIEFWSVGGTLDEEDWPKDDPERPVSVVLSISASFVPGDEVMVALQDDWPLPDGQYALLLRGARRGTTFLNSNNPNEKSVASRLVELMSTYRESF